MEYSEEQIKKIYDMAAVFTPLSDIAVLIDVDLYSLRMDVMNISTPVGKAYARGKAQASLELRKQEMSLAMAGSPLGLESVSASYERMIEDELT